MGVGLGCPSPFCSAGLGSGGGKGPGHKGRKMGSHSRLLKSIPAFTWPGLGALQDVKCRAWGRG